MKYFTIIPIFLMALLFTSCFNCVDCTACDDTTKDTTGVCYEDAKPYYQSRREWRQDVKAYEKAYDCKCN